MTSQIKEVFGGLSISITNREILHLEKCVISWTLRKTNPLTLDGAELGVNPIAFTTSDYNALFDIFNIHKADVEKAIRNIPAIDRSFNVISDPFNLLSMWLVHLAPIYIKDKHVCYNFQMMVLRYLHYKFFTSVVNNSLRHGANPGVMQSVLNELTKKSDIVKYGSWRLLIDSHCEKILDPKDRFYETLIDGSPDDMYLRVLSESQTALRSKLVTFVRLYFNLHEQGESVGSRSAVAENDEGEKILAQVSSVIESASASIVSEVLNPNTFINDISVNDIAELFSTISPRMLKTALLKINETAVLQISNKSFDKVEKTKEGNLYIGIRVLIIEIIRSMTSLCRAKRVSMGNKAEVFKTMKDAFSSSRNSGKDILAIKRSIAHLVDEFNITSNLASQSTLRLATIYYILYRTIQKLHT